MLLVELCTKYLGTINYFGVCIWGEQKILLRFPESGPLEWVIWEWEKKGEELPLYTILEKKRSQQVRK